MVELMNDNNISFTNIGTITHHIVGKVESISYTLTFCILLEHKLLLPNPNSTTPEISLLLSANNTVEYPIHLPFRTTQIPRTCRPHHIPNIIGRNDVCWIMLLYQIYHKIEYSKFMYGYRFCYNSWLRVYVWYSKRLSML